MFKRSIIALILSSRVFGDAISCTGSCTKINSDSIVDHGHNDITLNFFSQFQDYDTYCSWFKNLSDKYPSYTKFNSSIGTTSENNKIFSFTITDKTNNVTERPIIYMQSLIHAREYISGSTLAYIVKYLSNSYEVDPLVKCVLSKADLLFVPVANPDGFKYTFEKNRMWRKNRSKKEGFPIDGVDLNRNFPFLWDHQYYIIEDSFNGFAPASELETQAIIKLIKDKNVLGSIDFHSFSQLILYPYGHTKSDSISHERHNKIAEEMIKVISNHNYTFTAKKIYDVYNQSTTGTLADWIYNQSGNKTLSFTIELPPGPEYLNPYSTRNGFIVKTSEIVKVGEALVPAIKIFLKEATGC